MVYNGEVGGGFWLLWEADESDRTSSMNINRRRLWKVSCNCSGYIDNGRIFSRTGPVYPFMPVFFLGCYRPPGDPTCGDPTGLSCLLPCSFSNIEKAWQTTRISKQTNSLQTLCYRSFEFYLFVHMELISVLFSFHVMFETRVPPNNGRYTVKADRRPSTLKGWLVSKRLPQSVEFGAHQSGLEGQRTWPTEVWPGKPECCPSLVPVWVRVGTGRLWCWSWGDRINVLSTWADPKQ